MNMGQTEIMEFMNENSEIIIALLGMITAFLIWLQLRTQSSMKDKDAKIETIENRQIEIQSQADQRQAQMDILKSALADIPKSRETWQAVVDKMSERHNTQRERTMVVLEKLDKNIEQNSITIANLTNVIEIQSTNYARLTTAVQDTKAQSIESVRVVTERTRETQTSVDSVKDTIQQSFQLVQDTLKTLEARFDEMLTTQHDHIDAQGQRHNDLRSEIRAISDAIKTLGLVVDNIHKLVEKIETQPIPQVTDTTHDTTNDTGTQEAA